MQSITVVDILAIILSIVSLIITIIGFFASLKFYRDGVNLQNLANDALIKVEERTQNIQSQFVGVFDKTLDAALGHKELLKQDFQALNDQIESSTRLLVEEAQKQIGDAGIEERKRLKSIVDQQMSLLRERVKDTRETAEELAESSIVDIPITRFQVRVLEVLKRAEKPLSRPEIAKELGTSQSTTQNAINKLLFSGLIKMYNSNDQITRFVIRNSKSREA